MLSDKYQVVFYDQRGSGLSPREDHPDPSMEAFVRDRDSLVDLRGMGKKMRLIGHSWGRIKVTAYLTWHPDKVSHAAVAEPSVLHPESAKAFVMKLREHPTFWKKVSVLPIILRYPFVFSEDGHNGMDYIATKILQSSEGPPYQCEGEKLPSGICRRAGYAIMKATVVPLMEDPALFRVDYTDGLQKYAEKILLLSCEFYRLQVPRAISPAKVSARYSARNDRWDRAQYADSKAR